jgi:hypothetical protein
VGAHVLHSCDTRSCVNAEHLRLGTPTENCRDTRERGRLHTGPIKQITPRDVIAIFGHQLLGNSQARTAKVFGVSYSTVNAVLNRRSYREAFDHVESIA